MSSLYTTQRAVGFIAEVTMHGVTHVLPSDEHGERLPGHVPSMDCRCSPERDPVSPAIIMHYETIRYVH